MTEIFLSRPTWVPEEFSEGIEAFEGLLQEKGISPRTVGASVFPNQGPLDEVIRLMDQCSGAIILGIPQIEVEAGAVKGEPLKEIMLLSTEWNHIEAGLAYARGIPLLVIHHVGVYRGIFDKGAFSGFLYEKDLTRPGWPVSEDIRGAVATWKSRLGQVEQAKAQGEQPQDEAKRSASLDEVGAEEFAILKILGMSNENGRGKFTLDEISYYSDMSRPRIERWLNSLIEKRLVSRSLIMMGPNTYGLNDDGLALLVDNDFL